MAELGRTIDYELVIGDKDATTFSVIDFEVHEAVSSLTRAVVRVGLAREVTPTKLIGRAATFSIVSDDLEAPRLFRGIVTRASFESGPEGKIALAVVIEPALAALKLGTDNRIFPEDDSQGVTKKVLDKAKLKGVKISWSLKKPPPKQLHILQRNESDFAFISRLMARDGINFVLQEAESEQQLIFFDDSKALPDISGDPTLLNRALAPSGSDTIYGLREEATVRSNAIAMRAYNPLMPQVDMTAAASKDQGSHEIYLHPGDYDDVAVGKRLAQLHLDAASVEGRGIIGNSNSPRLEPGRYLTIGGHGRDALNGRVLLRQVVHRGNVDADEGGRRASYENAFWAVPEGTQLRPAPRPAEPRGGSVAFVTTPPGEEIHVDELGRIKVSFPWDRAPHKDDKSSGWLRVGQLPLSGSMVLPRGGFEVLVDHALGDPNLPAIVGHLYNGKSPPPYGLPEAATVSSLQTATTSGGSGSNELRFEDKGGGEEIFINASKDFTLSVDNNSSFSSGKNETSKVGSNFEQSVGTNHQARVTSNRTLTVGASQSLNINGDYSETVGTNDDVTIGGMRKVQSGGDHAETTTGTLDRTVGSLQSVTGIKGVGRTIVGASKVSAGAAWMEMVGKNRASDVAGSRKETVAALKMIKAKDAAVTVTNNLTVNAAAEMAKCGGSRADNSEGALAITTGAGLTAKAKTITIEAKQSLVMILGACMIRLAKSGKVVIKAPTVNLKGAKAIGQIKHGSN